MTRPYAVLPHRPALGILEADPRQGGRDRSVVPPNTHFGRDMVNVVVGTIWQTSLVLLPIYVVLLRLVPGLISLALAVATSWILKKNWLDHLEEDDPAPAHDRVTKGGEPWPWES